MNHEPWPDPGPAAPEAARHDLDLSYPVLAAGAAPVALGYLLLCALVYGPSSDPFGAATMLSLAFIGFGLVFLVPIAVFGLFRSLLRRRWRVAAIGLLAMGGATLSAATWFGWLGIPRLESEWVLPVTTTFVAIAAALAVVRSSRTAATAAVLAVGITGGLFGWGIARALDVRVVLNPSPMRAAAADAVLMFEASESGDYEIRTGAGSQGGCLRGRRIASGIYGPGWEETDAPTGTAKVPLGDTGLVEGENALVVCVRHGVASGEARAVVVVDDTSPAEATLDIQPTTRLPGVVDHRTATTRSLSFSGTAPVDSRAILQMDGLWLHDLAIVEGRWSVEWTLSPMTDQAAFGVVAEDAADNTSRSNMIHVRFVGIDPPPVVLEAYPGLSIECRGEPALDGEACRAWATATLAGRPELLPNAARLLLQLPGRFGDCYAETRGKDGFTVVGIIVDCPDEGT
jgi:hypothetical protein